MNAGKRGFSLIPFKTLTSTNEYVFFFQFRSDDLGEKSARLVINDVTIKFCPWCGTKLSDIVTSNKSVIEEIALKNRNLIKI